MTTSLTMTRIPIISVQNSSGKDIQDVIAVEEPLEIQLSTDSRPPHTVSITMRTPGNDLELATGFLWSEGAITSPSQILSSQSELNVIRITTTAEVFAGLDRLNRSFYTTSSCGVCGKTSLDAIRQQAQFVIASGAPTINAHILTRISDTVRRAQETFNQTGGLHGAALLRMDGELTALREDVGRHNAVDKLIGAQILADQLPLSHSILFLSGRASFELLQKARMAGIPIVAAVGAPSSLAVEMAQDAGITLIGFLRGERFNVYSGASRVKLAQPMEITQ